MSSASLYSEDYFVVLQPGEAEQIVSAAELLTQLEQWLEQYPDALPADLQQQPSRKAQAQALQADACELELEPGRTAQWYAIRLEK
ncbi:MAG: chlororespiratory reduction protein 7 [Synechococcales cyanobacterium RM1_1_8]|nr:chlororespiratory reduction protein 7 [Synechococcales cyanobacterium RM1_1_8]